MVTHQLDCAVAGSATSEGLPRWRCGHCGCRRGRTLVYHHFIARGHSALIPNFLISPLLFSRRVSRAEYRATPWFVWELLARRGHQRCHCNEEGFGTLSRQLGGYEGYRSCFAGVSGHYTARQPHDHAGDGQGGEKRAWPVSETLTQASTHGRAPPPRSEGAWRCCWHPTGRGHGADSCKIA
jgi:hypothetical protein